MSLSLCPHPLACAKHMAGIQLAFGEWMDGWMDDCPYHAPGRTLMHHFGISGCSTEQLQSGPHFIIGVTAPSASL